VFTGLIETQGAITRIERVAGGARLEVNAPGFRSEVAIGDSIAVDGACLTVVCLAGTLFAVDVSEETLSKTTLGGLSQGSKVNLERALRLSDRLGGHLVSGHIDGVGRLQNRHQAGNSTTYQFQAPEAALPFLAQKGSVAVDGISLTIADTQGDGFTVAVIPHTERMTTLEQKRIGAQVNIEVDLLARYVGRLMGLYAGGNAHNDGSAAAGAKRGLADMLRGLTDEA
jgi:riboflavin synthase